MANQTKIRKQIRGFVLVWSFITLVMGFATFVAIYFTYNPNPVSASDEGLSVALPANGNGGNEPIIVLPSVTPRPTNTPSPTVEVVASPTPEATIVAQVAATEVPTEASTPTMTPTTPPIDVDHFEVGIQVQYSLDFNPKNQDGWYRSVANDLGLGWVKVQVRWEDIERVKGERDFAVLDLVMPSAERFNLKTLISVVTAPEWAREPGVDVSRHGPPANVQDYADFVAAIVQRYPGQIHAIEVWNEMNLDREWTSVNGLSAVNYTKLLQATYQSVKAVDPNVIIVTGALSPTGVDDGVTVIDDFRFTDLLLQAGALNYADCYGAHHNGINFPPAPRWNEGFNDPTAQFRGPFDNPHHSWSFRSTLEGYATRIRNAGYETPLCVTEFGWAVAEDLGGYPRGFEFAQDNTLEEQAQWITEAMSLMEEWGFVRLAIVWNFNYGPQAGYDPNNDNVPYSIIGPDFKFRPAYDAIREWQKTYQERLQNS